MKEFLSKSYEARILALFLFLLAFYLVIAYLVHAPMGYYGTIDEPRIGDPWIERTEGILGGGILYEEIYTTTPPLINYLLIIPSLVPIFFGRVNPWATLSFMLYFALFNLFTAYVLLYMAENRKEGWQAAAFFLLNPLTFGNAVLRRQDEAVLAFFFALALLLVLKRHHLRAGVAMGAVLLIKLSGLLLIPVGFLHSRNWRYLIVPPLVFGLVFGPFVLLAGTNAMFWDFGERHAQHPFQLGGISLVALWSYRYGGPLVEGPQTVFLQLLSILFVIGLPAAVAWVAWKRFGVLEDMSILIAAVLLFSPKLHAGYFSLLALTMAPLLKRDPYRLGTAYFVLGGLVIVGDFYKWPIRDYQIAFWIIAVVYLLLLYIVVRLSREPALTPPEAALTPPTPLSQY